MKLWELLETTDCVVHIKEFYHEDVTLDLFPCLNPDTHDVIGYIPKLENHSIAEERRFAYYSDWNVSKIHITENGLDVYLK